ncbi:MAG: tyrosine-protein phosphatase, partial [Prevotella sp.]|nr:tyrosine-protein phosphatase [Prevotella sp.]
NTYLSGKYDNLLAEKPNLRPLFEVKPEFLMAGIEQIRKSHGTVENYLKTVLNVNIDLLRKMYLE